MTKETPASLNISADEARELQSDPHTTFLDVRSPDNFAERHIVGAISVPMNRLEDDIALLSKERPVIVYCATNSDERSLSTHVVQLLRSKGYNAYAITGGLDGWVAAGFDVAMGV